MRFLRSCCLAAALLPPAAVAQDPAPHAFDIPTWFTETFLDVREDHEFAKDHAKGARHLGKGIIERDVETLIPNKQEAVLLYCGGGYRSMMAISIMKNKGFKNLINVYGGFGAMQQAGLEIVSEEVPV